MKRISMLSLVMVAYFWAGANPGIADTTSLPGNPADLGIVSQESASASTGGTTAAVSGAASSTIPFASNDTNRIHANLTPIPEPSTWPMIGLGFFLLFARQKTSGSRLSDKMVVS